MDVVRSLVLCLVVILCGCTGADDAPELALVEGIVTLKNTPVADASVMFTPESGPIAVGTTNGDGHFSLTTNSKPGASIGTHRVTIVAFEPVAEPPAAANGSAPDGEQIQKSVSRIPLKYSDLKQSDLTANVQEDPGLNDFTFDLQ